MQTISKKDIPEELTVTIEKLSNLGLGIAKIDGYVIFIEGACPGDTARIRIGKKNKNYAFAKVLEIIKSSDHRTTPFCPMQKICGACQLQFIDYDYQLELKKEIVIDTMHSICGNDNIEVRDVIPSPKTKEYRHKIQYPVSETKDSKRILAGYYRQNSHEIVNIKYCPVQPAYCDEIIEFIRRKASEYKVSGYTEKTHTGDLRHIVIRTSQYNNKSLVILVMNFKKLLNKYKLLAEKIFTELENIAGVGINYNDNKTNLILGEKTEILFGDDYIEEKLCDKIFKIGAKTFFQVNPSSADNIFKYIKEYIHKNYKSPVILDAYAGITAFGISLADIAQKVVSVEEVKESVSLAKEIAKENGLANLEINHMDAGKFFEQEVQNGRRYDITILDPPRKGCSKESLDYALKLTKSDIIYVSCNPATLARDLKYLMEKGCKAEFIQPFDMFPHTYHIENVAILHIGN